MLTIETLCYRTETILRKQVRTPCSLKRGFGKYYECHSHVFMFKQNISTIELNPNLWII